MLITRENINNGSKMSKMCGYHLWWVEPTDEWSFRGGRFGVYTMVDGLFGDDFRCEPRIAGPPRIEVSDGRSVHS